MNQIVLTRIELNSSKYIIYLELNDNKQIVNLRLSSDDSESILNNIYTARVDNIVPNINSAFVRINQDTNCYLSLNNIRNCIYTHKYSKKEGLCAGDEILVQVVKDAVKTKDYTVSTKLTLYGRYSILTTDNTSISVSKKIDKTYSQEIKTLINDQYTSHEDEGYGLIIRTNAQNITHEELLSDIYELVNLYTSIKEKAAHSSIYSCVYHSPAEYILTLNSVNLSEIERIITDQPDIYALLLQYINSKYADLLSLYQDDMVQLSTLYNINSQLDKLLSKKIWLNSGANIIIEQLETLTVIDVNTAKNQSKKNNFLRINIEAAIEIIRQLKLRNISGMIIIDFINMKNDKDIETLIRTIKSQIQKEDTNCSFIDITKLGLVELTRKKTHKSLKEQLSKNN